MGHLVEGILHLPPAWLLLVAGLLVFVEDAVFVGFVVPGESAAVLAGVATAIGDVSLPVAIAVIVLAAIAGDSVGYEVGRRYLTRLLRLRMMARHRERVERARGFLARRGGVAVFLGRFTAFFRAMMPALAGAAHMPYRRFLVWNAVGGLVWGTGFVLLGHLAGASYHAVEKQVGRGVAVVLVVVVVLLLVAWRVHAHRQHDQDA
ncbi:DedA family protein [Nocardioides mangrovicus]|uniref:DedA family protein n=1 Tax=Nocardioides mangrovicus TaxID=2478913 RepID=A0A3L8NYR1_9ACTN|nr:DedA family protein [Nocardioides mangrovicus]RLV47499.1 DedA family protein [Nocardioides mangrovicus]